MNKIVWVFALSIINSETIFSQQPAYDPVEAFAPFFYSSAGDRTRSADGTPGPDYWQNRADYKIDVALNDQTRSISGKVFITYTNNSPSALSFIWLQLDQNIKPRFPEGGYTIHKINVYGQKDSLEYEVYDTRMKIYLPKPLKPFGGKLKFSIDYCFQMPNFPRSRMGITENSDGDIYAVAQWYPRMCVYDNIVGWNTLPYLGQGEFYLEYGNIDYSITVPATHIVVGSGELTNPKEVLTTLQINRLQKAARSDSTVFIRTALENEMEKTIEKRGTKTWRFKCIKTRDAAWASSKSFIWDAASINLPGGKTALAMSVYPAKSSGSNRWGKSTEYTKYAVEFYSRYLIPFTYPVATNVACEVYGMEYPGIVFCSMNAKGKDLWNVTSHEFGHNWFPMIVGSNERSFPWMDEGINTFINSLVNEVFGNGAYLKRRKISADTVIAARAIDQPIMIHADAMRDVGLLGYNKPALGFRILRDVILGPERFDNALKYYVEKWSFKHPTPWDFFRCIENSTGENLSWFWRGWFFDNWRVDFAISEVKEENEGDRSLITIKCLEKLPMPLEIEITDADEKKLRRKFSVELWQKSGTVTIWGLKNARKVEIDPDGLIPDINRSNNIWENK